MIDKELFEYLQLTYDSREYRRRRGVILKTACQVDIPCRNCGNETTEETPVCLCCGQTAPGIYSTCPSCGSRNYVYKQYGWALGRSIAGAYIAGPLGLLLGGVGQSEAECVCLNCGQGWFPFSRHSDWKCKTRKFDINKYRAYANELKAKAGYPQQGSYTGNRTAETQSKKSNYANNIRTNVSANKTEAVPSKKKKPHVLRFLIIVALVIGLFFAFSRHREKVNEKKRLEAVNEYIISHSNVEYFIDHTEYAWGHIIMDDSGQPVINDKQTAVKFMIYYLLDSNRRNLSTDGTSVAISNIEINQTLYSLFVDDYDANVYDDSEDPYITNDAEGKYILNDALLNEDFRFQCYIRDVKKKGNDEAIVEVYYSNIVDHVNYQAFVTYDIIDDSMGLFGFRIKDIYLSKFEKTPL